MSDICIGLVSPDGGTHALFYDAIVLVPNLIFLIFLTYTARRCFDILSRSPSMIMWTYYCLVWAVTLCNFLRTALQLIGISPAHPDVRLWNVLWLATRFIMTMLEVSVVVFLLHGYVPSSRAALNQTLLISGAVAVASTTLEGVFIWSLDIQLYTFSGDDYTRIRGDMQWGKWGFWLANALFFAVVYAGLLLLPLTPWRALLPAKDRFHHYVRALCALNVIAAAGAIMIGKHAGAGYCVFGATNMLYYTLYGPLLYFTFLASFFQSDEVDLENYYYSEMREAGFLDSDAGDPFLSAP